MRGMAAFGRFLPTVMDSFVLSFVFFLLSDMHQIAREPTLENLLGVLTSLQLTANSPFDYPAFIFLGIFLVNVAGIIRARLNSGTGTKIRVLEIPLQPGPSTRNEAISDCLHMAGILRSRAAELGITEPVSMVSISGYRSVDLTDLDVSAVDSEITRVVPEVPGVARRVDGSPVTSGLLSVLSRIGLPIGGMYHPIQGKISINPSLDALSWVYVYIHEVLHSLGLGEVSSEVGTIEVCLRLSSLRGLPLDLLGNYLLFRSVVSQLISINAIGDVEGEIDGLYYGWSGMGSYLIEKTRGRMEKRIYREIKSSDFILREEPSSPPPGKGASSP